MLVKGSWGCRDDPDLSLYLINLSREELGASSLPLLLFLLLLAIILISNLFHLLSCLFECFSFYPDKGDRRRRVEWLPATKFEQVRLALLLPVSSHNYNMLLTKENLQRVCQHPDKFTSATLARLRTANYNFDHKVHKFYK